MIDKKSNFNAPDSAAGYFYQARLALLECLRYIYGEFPASKSRSSVSTT